MYKIPIYTQAQPQQWGQPASVTLFFFGNLF